MIYCLINILQYLNLLELQKIIINRTRKLKTLKKTLTAAFIFSIAMGILEAIVVVYLRDMFYSTGFKFPLKIIPGPIIKVEILREFCTLVMLVTVAFIAGKKKLGIFSYFLFCFAVWDIAYYAGLKLILNWPPSLFTWDILFLIPLPWIGPVLAPIISSLTMILLSLLLLFLPDKRNDFKVKKPEWALIYAGAFIIFISFIWDYANIVISNGLLKVLLSPGNSALRNITINYMPRYFNWSIFIAGLCLIYISMFLIIKRYFPFNSS